MLCDVVQQFDAWLGSSERLEQGVYLSTHFNFECNFRKQNYDLDYPEFPDDETEFNAYGVCDGLLNLKAKLPREVLDGPRKFVISLCEIRKDEQPENGGWRWHKWGPYIGTQTPTTEYLSDEPEINRVFTYHVYLVESYHVYLAE